MKKLYSFFLFILFVSFSYGQEIDLSSVIEIPSAYADQIGDPLIVKKDSLYVFRTPDVYLVNKKYYLTLIKISEIAGTNDDVTQTLIENYKKTLRRNIDLESKLENNFNQTDSFDKIMYEKTLSTINDTQKSLDSTINRLEKATSNLDVIKENTRKQRRKSAFEKILFALGGVGIGVLVGVSL